MTADEGAAPEHARPNPAGAAVTPVGGRPLWRALAPYVADLRRPALVAGARFEQNARALEEAIVREVGAGASSPEEADARVAAAAARLEDPDVSVAFADALRAGGRNPDAHSHGTLAKLIAARLAAQTNSAPAVTANLAVRAMESLGAVHLRTLALLALAQFAGRPNPASALVPRSLARPGAGARRDGGLQVQAASQRHDEAATETDPDLDLEVDLDSDVEAARYAAHLVDRLRSGAERVGVPEDVPAGVAIHLVAASCVVRHDSDPELYRALAQVIGAPARLATQLATQSRSDRAARVRDVAMERAYHVALFLSARQDATLARLSGLWSSSLHHLALTPAGMLIGLAALDALTGERTSHEWQQAGTADHALVLSEYAPAPAVNKEWAHDRAFHDVLGEALADMAERRDPAIGRVLRAN